jgi:uncharacterized protein YjdB
MKYAAILFGCALTGCSSDPVIVDNCFVNLIEVTPQTATLQVGDTLRYSAAIIGPQECLPPGVTATSPIRWTTPDPTIIQVDSLNGLLHALAEGNASVVVSAKGTQGTSALGSFGVAVTGAGAP